MIPGKKIIYSGDTRPCKNLINYARGCQLLIHEATFTDSFDKKASINRHTTTSQALDLIKEIQPKTSVLTHFTNRQLLPEITQRHTKLRVMVAFDQMRLKIKDLEWVHKLLPVFEEVFNDGTANFGIENQRDSDSDPE